MNRISLNVIVFNEEARLEACLSDAREHVDEIVVVDQMSTDATPEIAQRLADVYVRDVHHGHAEPSRELAASRSSGDWLLILDADEQMSDLLKAELRDLTERDTDGYWIRKENSVDGAAVSTVLHFRLVRKTRVRFDPNPHGGATPVSDNVERYDRIGIVHKKSLAEQIFDDARYERMALEDDAPTSSKRNWLQHNRTLRAERKRARRLDLEALVPAGAARVLVVGDVAVELPGCTLARVALSDPVAISADAAAALGAGNTCDAAILAPAGEDPLAAVRAVAGLLGPEGVIIGTAPAARNRRRIEEFIAGVLADGTQPETPAPETPAPETPAPGASTRRELLDGLSAAGLDARWTGLVRDGWLDPIALRPDGSDTVVESDDFFLRKVPADAAEELTAEEIVFAAVRPRDTDPPECSIIVVALADEDPRRFSETLLGAGPRCHYELVVVASHAPRAPIAGATTVLVADDADFPARWNAGARAAAGELLLFVAADAAPSPGWLDVLVEVHRSRPDSGAVGSKVVARDGTVEHAGLVLGPDRIPYRIYQGDAATASYVNRARIMPAVAAEGMITSRARFVEIGGFDETLGADLSAADFCMRLRARGLPIVYSPAAALRSQLRCVPGSRGVFHRSAREFATRWSPTTFRSDDAVCRPDGREVSFEWNRSWRLPRPTGPAGAGLPAIAWTSHFLEQGGYTEEALAAVEALEDDGLYVVANPVTGGRRASPLPARKAERLTALMERNLPDRFVHVAHIGANRFKRHPSAIRSIGRTMFETDGLPAEWRDLCNAMDEVWVPSEHNLHTFANAGVAPSKLHKVPETFDTELFDPGVAPLAIEGVEGFVFLSVFSWIGRKAWDVLLRAWFEEFGAHDDVTLLLKTDTAIAPAGTDCQRDIDLFVRGQLNRDPRKGPRIVVHDQQIDMAEVPRLYRAADAFVLASHGEGWGRPYMEAMAMGLPTIATRWSGNLEFMNDDNSYLVGYRLVDAPADSWLGGHRWADPSVSDLRRAMRRVYEHRDEALATGMRARADVLVSCSPELVAQAVRERIEAITRAPAGRSPTSQPRLDQPAGASGAAPSRLDQPAGPSRTDPSGLDQPVASSAPRRRPLDGRRITACVITNTSAPALSGTNVTVPAGSGASVTVPAGSDTNVTPAALSATSVSAPALSQCLDSLRDAADTTVVLDAGSGDDMAAVRNEALDRATGGWILMIDATCTLDPTSVPLVRELVAHDEFVGYAARELHQFGMDGAISAIEQRLPILFPRDPDLRYVGRVAERLLPQRADLRFRFVPSQLVVHQHDHSGDRYHAVARARRHLPLLERSVREAPEEPFHRYNLGLALHRLGLNSEAEIMLREAIELAPRRAIWRASAYASLSRAVGAQGGRAEEAVKLCKVATKRAPKWAQGWSMLAAALLDAGRPKAALRAYTSAVNCDGSGALTWDGPDEVAWQARAGMARIHLSLHQYTQAAECLGGALALNPDHAELHVLLARAYEASGRSGDARRHLESATLVARAGADSYAAMGDFFTKKAEEALLRGLVDNAESRMLLVRLERLRASRAII